MQIGSHQKKENGSSETRNGLSHSLVLVEPEDLRGPPKRLQASPNYTAGKLISLHPILVGTHDGKSHLDDQAALALMSLAFGDRLTVVRTRDEGVLAKCDFLVDVGGSYDHTLGRSDHHQTSGQPPARSDGANRSSIGTLLMDHALMNQVYNNVLGREVASDECEQLNQYLDHHLIRWLDARDIGEIDYEPSKLDGRPLPNTLQAHLNVDRYLSPNQHFVHAVENFKDVLSIFVHAGDPQQKPLESDDGMAILADFLRQHTESEEMKELQDLALVVDRNPSGYSAASGVSSATHEGTEPIKFSCPTLLEIGALAVQRSEAINTLKRLVDRRVAYEENVRRGNEAIDQELVPSFQNPVVPGVAATHQNIVRDDIRRNNEINKDVAFIIYPDLSPEETWRLEKTGDLRIPEEIKEDPRVMFVHNMGFVGRLKPHCGRSDTIAIAMKCIAQQCPDMYNNSNHSEILDTLYRERSEDPKFLCSDEEARNFAETVLEDCCPNFKRIQVTWALGYSQVIKIDRT